MKLEVQNVKKPYIFRYRPDNNFTLDEIKNNYVFFPNRELLNDPFDANHKLIEIIFNENEYDKYIQIFSQESKDEFVVEYLKKKYPDTFSLKKLFNESIENFINRYGIACFTVSPVNFMLWASYSNNYQGICIQYNTDLDKSFFDDLNIINYVDDFKTVKYNFEDGFKPFRDLFFRKIRLWKEEYEVRLLKNNHGKHQVNPEAIRSVIFGLRTKTNYKKKIIEIVRKHQPHIMVYESTLMEDEFGLTMQPVIIK